LRDEQLIFLRLAQIPYFILLLCYDWFRNGVLGKTYIAAAMAIYHKLPRGYFNDLSLLPERWWLKRVYYTRVCDNLPYTGGVIAMKHLVQEVSTKETQLVGSFIDSGVKLFYPTAAMVKRGVS